MPETSRQRLLKAIDHEQPEVVPVDILAIDDLEAWLKRFDADDFFELREKLGIDNQVVAPVYIGKNTDVDHNIWHASLKTMGAKGAGYSSERGGYPLMNATSIADVENFSWPNPDDFDYEIVGKVLRGVPSDKHRMARLSVAIQAEGQSCEKACKTGGYWLPILCQVFDLMGMEQTLLNLSLNPKVVEAVIKHLEIFYLEYILRILQVSKGQLDSFRFGDDFASQRGMILSPVQWRKFLKRTYAKIADLVKSYDLKIWFHSCGTFRPVMTDLIGIGMDVWETSQVHLQGNEPEELKREYGKYITFFGAINSQKTLPFGSPEDVRAEVRERIKVLGKGGGYICGPDHTIMPEVPIENVIAMLDEAKKFRF